MKLRVEHVSHCASFYPIYLWYFLIYKIMNMRNSIISVVVIIFLGFLWVALPYTKSPNAGVQTAAALNAEETYFDFGTISMVDGVVSHVFGVKNEGAESVIIKKVYTSCMCTTAFIEDKSGDRYGEFGMPGHGGVARGTNIKIAPGESISVKAVFDPAAHGPSGVGLSERSIYLETNSVQSPRVELKFRAVVAK